MFFHLAYLLDWKKKGVVPLMQVKDKQRKIAKSLDIKVEIKE